MKIQEVNSQILSGLVERFHAVPGVSKQTNSQHQWGVAVLCQHLHPTCGKNLIMAAIVHDMHELFTGDVPHDVKLRYPEVKAAYEHPEAVGDLHLGISWVENLSPFEKIILKSADILECIMYCIHRYECGEKHAKIPIEKLLNLLEQRTLDAVEPTPKDEKVGLTQITMESVKVNINYLEEILKNYVATELRESV